ncbi:5-hydroxytryptamine receptor 3A-like [Hyla sarda]|uniref:5-hydroxytryptamine receptor 3A-like n=1 Tax=Hyla sarda TaxID=327740 RepID=UPI0024C2ED0B|nr:5-hydroxytryptamine receptor 3A-like [Hyla sarda]
MKSNTSPLVELSDYLMDGYNKGVRPKKNWRDTTTVFIEVAINAILELEEKNQIVKSYILYNQSWVDDFLQWDPIQFDNITHIYLPTDSIWTPDIMIEEVVGTAESTDIPYTYVNSKGMVFKSNPMHITTSCSMHIYYFPFDFLNCSLSFRSWLHSTQDINITFLRPPKDMIRLPSENEGEWNLVSVVPGYHLLTDHNFHFGQIKYHVSLRRRPLFYIVNLILPSILLMIMDIIGFYIPPESGERISYKITLLLGYSVFLLIVSDTLPAAGAPLIGVYFALCMIMLLISLTESILIVRSFHQKNLRPEVPKWLKTLLLEKITFFISIKDQHQSDASNSGTCFQNENVSSETPPNYSSEKESECYVPAQLKMVYAKHLEVLNHIAEEISRIRVHLKTVYEQNIQKDWQRVAYVLDTLLFRVYLAILITTLK